MAFSSFRPDSRCVVCTRVTEDGSERTICQTFTGPAILVSTQRARYTDCMIRGDPTSSPENATQPWARYSSRLHKADKVTQAAMAVGREDMDIIVSSCLICAIQIESQVKERSSDPMRTKREAT